MRIDGEGRRTPVLRASDLARSAEDLHLRSVDVASVASAQLHAVDLNAAAHAVEKAIQNGERVVVSVGTDALAETAFYLAETLGNPQIAVTGAMRPQDHHEYDGIRNLRAAVHALEVGVPGTVVSFGDRVIPAWSVAKMNTVSLHPFDGSSAPMLNHIGHLPSTPPRLSGIWVIPAVLDPPPFELAISDRARCEGIILESLGTGSIPRKLRDSVHAAASEGIPVVLTSRVPSGPVEAMDLYPKALDDLKGVNVMVEDNLRADKARLRLAICLSTGRHYEPSWVGLAD